MSSGQQIRESWEVNAGNWVATLDNEEIESRSVATNNAIVQQVLKSGAKKVLDLGCGEGWLSRTLRKENIDVWGIDAVQELIDVATKRDGNFYLRLTYEEIISGQHKLPVPFDAAVINFSLLDKETTDALIIHLPKLLKSKGYLLIQTLHPLAMVVTGDYVSGWKEGSWNGLKQPFVLPYQWYFRTLEDWFLLFNKAGFVVKSLAEPVHPQTQKPLSLIFTLEVGANTCQI